MPKMITGFRGEPHVTADDMSKLQQGIICQYDAFLANAVEPVVTQQTGNIVILPRMNISIMGTQVRISEGEPDKATIESGSAGKYRYDYVGVQYSKDGSSGVESATIRVIKGTDTEDASNVAEPDVTPYQNDIRAGGTSRFVPLYRISLNGVNINTIPGDSDWYKRIIPGVRDLRDITERLSAMLKSINSNTASATDASDRLKALEKSPTISNDIFVERNSSPYARARLAVLGGNATNQANARAVLSVQMKKNGSYPSGDGEGSSAPEAALRVKSGIYDSKGGNYSGGTLTFHNGKNEYEIPMVQRGSVKMKVSTASTAVSQSITFPNAFSESPFVSVNVRTTDPLKANAFAHNITSTSFTLYFNNTSTAELTVEWIAFGSTGKTTIS